MSLKNVVSKLKVLAEEPRNIGYIVFKNKDAVMRRLKITYPSSEKPEDTKKAYERFEATYGKIVAITDAKGVDLITYQEAKPSLFKVTFSSGKATVQQDVPVVAGDKVPQIISKAMRQLKKDKPDLRVDNVLKIEDSNGVVIFDPIRDLAKKFR